MRVCLLVLLVLTAVPCRAEDVRPVRLLLSVGSDLGDPDEPLLHHAEDDAQRVSELFVELGGVEASRALVLKRPSAARVTERFAELTGRIAELKAAGKSVELLVFVSAHGKQASLHLAGTRLPLASLRQLTQQTGADLTITVIDACEAGGARDKGARPGPAYQLELTAQPASGEVFIASSGATEAAQEWDVLSGSLFTHHLVSGLRGDADADGDGRVSLMEAYGYAERRTVANSVDRGQHPEFSVALKGSNDVVLTALERGRARVVLPETLEGRFVLVSQPRADVVTEVTKRAGRTVTLAVPPGRYLLRQSRGFSVALQEIELPWGGVAKVDAQRFVVRDFSEVALKGGGVEFRPHAVQLLGSFASAPLEATPARWAVGLGYRLALGQLWGALWVGWGAASFRGVELTTRDDRFQARLAAGPRFWLGPASVMPALALELSVLRQESRRDREDEIRRSYPGLPIAVTPGVGVGPQLRVELPLVGPLFAALTATGWVRALAVTDLPTWTLGADGELALGLRL